jgi:hypothetical protein
MRTKRKDFAEDAKSISVIVESLISDMLPSQNQMKDKEVENFISTLTPGAQNAIRAASFVWGYENAMRYVKNAMKLDEVKNAQDTAEKSRAVIESLESQSKQSEKTADISKFVWSYYNEDLKEIQAQASKSEAISEKSKVGAPKEEEEQLHLPLAANSHEAAANSVRMGEIAPILSYCAASYQEAEAMQQQQAVEQKRKEFARLISAQGMKQPHESGKPESEEEISRKLLSDAAKIALVRREEAALELEKMEKQLKEAIAALDQFSEDEKEAAKKISQMLPRELALAIAADARKLAKKRALRAQLARWASFCRSARASILKMPASSIVRLATLSALFGGK